MLGVPVLFDGPVDDPRPELLVPSSVVDHLLHLDCLEFPVSGVVDAHPLDLGVLPLKGLLAVRPAIHFVQDALHVAQHVVHQQLPPEGVRERSVFGRLDVDEQVVYDEVPLPGKDVAVAPEGGAHEYGLAVSPLVLAQQSEQRLHLLEDVFLEGVAVDPRVDGIVGLPASVDECGFHHPFGIHTRLDVLFGELRQLLVLCPLDRTSLIPFWLVIHHILPLLSARDAYEVIFPLPTVEFLNTNRRCFIGRKEALEVPEGTLPRDDDFAASPIQQYLAEKLECIPDEPVAVAVVFDLQFLLGIVSGVRIRGVNLLPDLVDLDEVCYACRHPR